MDAPLHRKIKEACTIQRGKDSDGHWLLERMHTVWVDEVAQVVTTKRAAYASFVGPVPEGVDVYSACGIGSCICPWHLGQRKARGKARALGLPLTLAALSVPDQRGTADARMLPEGMTVHGVYLAKYLRAKGNPIAQIGAATGIRVADLVKLFNGAYDAAVRGAAKTPLARAAAKVARSRAGSPADIPDTTLEGSVVEVRGIPGPVEVPENASEEEAAWLGQISRG